MKDHKSALISYLSDYKVLGEVAAMKDLDLVCQAAMHHMRRNDTVVMLSAENLRGLSIVARAYYRKEMMKLLAEIGEFSVKLTMDKTLSDTLFISWD